MRKFVTQKWCWLATERIDGWHITLWLGNQDRFPVRRLVVETQDDVRKLFPTNKIVFIPMKRETARKQLAAAGYKPPQPPPVKAPDLKAVPGHRIAKRGGYKTP